MSLLPPEIFDRIIDHLYTDKTALRTCALVCRSWTAAARFHAFSTLELPRFSRARAGPLKLLCDAQSTVPRHVRRLHLEEGRGGKADPSWVLYPVLSRIRVDALVALSSVRLTNLGSYTAQDPPFGSALTRTTLAWLEGLCARVDELALVTPRVQSVWPVVLALVCAPRALRRLEVCSTRQYEDEGALAGVEEGRAPQLASLEEIEVDGHMYVLLDCLRVLCPGLRVSKLVMHDLQADGVPTLIKLFKTLGPALEHLELSTNDRGDASLECEADFVAAGGLSHCPGLATFFLWGDLPFYTDILGQIHAPRVREIRLLLAPPWPDALDPDALLELFARPAALGAARLVIEGQARDVHALIEMRRVAFERMHPLLEQGRLEFRRAGGESMDPEKQENLEELMDEFFS